MKGEGQGDEQAKILKASFPQRIISLTKFGLFYQKSFPQIPNGGNLNPARIRLPAG